MLATSTEPETLVNSPSVSTTCKAKYPLDWAASCLTVASKSVTTASIAASIIPGT